MERILALTTVILLVVSVPVLSEQTTLTQPRVSTMVRLLTRICWDFIFRAIMVRIRVTAARKEDTG